ncbi:MAG: 23S rRNA (uridine(2552)-2'-O)-methyltransferase RlmE [Coxiellaceae bacterium]|nr:23S rRNA (uridine(2552)-2'-O)-methyltransferase RlmE [Coxiellaceae bacterium]
MSKRWLKEHFSDQFVKQAQASGYLSRAAYKLLAIQEKDQIFKPGMTVVDLGAAPGGWSQVARDLVGDEGHVIALDILPMEPYSGVTFIQGDFREPDVLEQLLEAVGDRPVDVVISDMAPNLSGNKSIDQPRSMYLIELAWDCAQKILQPGGTFLAKVFQGEGVDAYIQDLRSHFKLVKSRKPEASRARSREFYLLSKGFLGYTDESRH